MDVNKVEYNGENGAETLIDLTADTVTPETLVKGATAHDKSGANIIGTADYAISSTSPISPITDSADGMVQGLTIYGRSEVVEGEIVSAGEGWSTVDLGTLDWETMSTSSGHKILRANFTGINATDPIGNIPAPIICAKYRTVSSAYLYDHTDELSIAYHTGLRNIWVSDINYIDKDPAEFKSAMSGVILCYELTDPSQGNAVAVKTDNGTRINGTMAEFTTGLPLRSVSDTVRDKLTCTADVKQVETVCGKVKLADLEWVAYPSQQRFYAEIPTAKFAELDSETSVMLSTKYTVRTWNDFKADVYDKFIAGVQKYIGIRDTDYTTVSDFVASLGDAELVYELATPITTPLTSAEISAFRGLKTYGSTTNITITDDPEFELEYLKNSDNGQAVANIQRDLQGQIDEVKNAAVMGSTIVVVTDEPTLYGRPVTVTAGAKTFTGTFDSSGECTFRNLAIYGAVQAESTDGGGNSAKGSTNITYFGTYVVGISFNVATINLTCSDVSFAGVPVSIYHNGEVVTETSLRLNGQGVLEGTAYVGTPGRYTATAVSAGKTVFTSVAVITLKQTYTGALAASYLPNSDIENIICEAYGDNFVEGALTWGNGQTPVAFNLNGSSVAPTLQEDNSVYIPVATNNIFASVDLGAPATPFTAYVVMKLRNPGTDSRMIGAMNSRSGGQGILLYSSTIQISSWANETSTGISSAQYVVCAIQFVGTNLGRGFVRGYGYAEKPSATAGQYVTLARPDINSSTSNASPGDGYFKYVAVVNEAESIQTVQANIEHLNSVFLGE